MKIVRTLVTFCLVVLTTVQPSVAWSECGHHIIAILAFDLMKPQEQQRLIELLGKHPRFADDLAPTPSGTAHLESVHRIIGRAAYWPDVVRNRPDFNRPTWHYQLGALLTIGDTVTVPATPAGLPNGATLKTQELYIVQAIQLCRETLRSESAAESDKAIAICWLAHLVADAHQPCHAGSLYAEGIFPEGDRGGNSIPTKQSRNLHALWDGLLGNRYDAAGIARRVKVIKAQHWESMEAELASLEHDPLRWLAESSEAARSHVYSTEVVNAVEAAKRSGTATMETVDLPESYLQAAGALTQKRAAFAAHRLAAILSADL